MQAFELSVGSSPLLVSIPHGGTYIPDDVKSTMTEQALGLPDTDWHVPKLYGFVRQRDVSVLEANYSRYYIDVNRSSKGESLYPGKSETELCPSKTFGDDDIYTGGMSPTDAEVRRRSALVWRPYHEALHRELGRIKSEFGYALLWDAHSIRSRVPRFFDGQLPDFNLGTGDGSSCPPELAQQLLALVSAHAEYSAVLNGRFKGGYITRQYGAPANDFVALQLELSQITYMDEDTFDYDPGLSAAVIPIISELLDVVMAYTPANK
jgi:N-formylglutamate deformylase